MQVSRLRNIPGIGVDRVGDAADAASDPEILRLENLDTDIPPPAVAVAATKAAVEQDEANSYLPFQGGLPLRRAAASYVGAVDGRHYDPDTQCVIVPGGTNGILNTLLATVEPGQEVVLTDPIYAGLINRVHLVGAVPTFVRSRPGADGWTTDPEELAAAIGPNTGAVLTMSPTMPTGATLGVDHWDAIAGPVERHGCWIIHDAAMERLRFDATPPSSPAAHPELGPRTITVGSASKELRMIGWRVGWIVGPQTIMADIKLVGMANVVCQVGIAQDAVAAALEASDVEADIAAATAVWAQRCDVVLDQLADYECVRPAGGWSLLMDTSKIGLSAVDAHARLLDRGQVAATPMNGWGPTADRYLRLVFSNEPVERLADLRERFDRSL